MHVCMSACMHACLYVCLYICIYWYTGVMVACINNPFLGHNLPWAPFLSSFSMLQTGTLAATPKGKVRGYCARLGSRRSHSLGPADLNVAAARTEDKEYIELVLVFPIFISLHFGVSIGSQADQGSDGCKTPVFPHQTCRCLQIRLRGISTQRHK